MHSYIKPIATHYYNPPAGNAFLRILIDALSFQSAVLAYIHLLCSSYRQAPIQLKRSKASLAELDLLSTVLQG